MINALKIKDSSQKAEFILKSLLIENKHNNSKIALNLYTPMLISLTPNSLSQSQAQTINYIHNINNPEKFDNAPFSQILLNPKNQEWDIPFISKHNAWNISNFLKYLGMQTPETLWESRLNTSSKKIKELNKKFSLNFSKNEFILCKLIESNIKEKNYLKAILFIGKLIDNKELKYLNLTTFQKIDMYLKDLDLLTLRNEFRKEVLSKKFYDTKNL